MKALPWLKRENARGVDIYIRPHDGRHILLEGISPDKIAELKRDGLGPAAVVESAPGQFQAWVTLDSNPVDESYSKKIAHQLAETSGTNTDAANPEHLGRLAGFTNRSPHHRRGGHFPYALVHDAKPQVASSGPALVRKEKELAGDTLEQTMARATAYFEKFRTRTRPDKTKIAVEQHLDALPAKEYQVTVRHTKDGQMQTKQFHGSREQFMGSLGWLKKQHAQGADITMRPLDSRYALAHNLNKDEVEFYQTSGLAPSVVLETAPSKYQAWFKLSNEPIEPEISQRVTDRFSEAYGAPDPANFGQLTGLGKAEIRDCQPQTAPRGAELIELLRKNIAKGPQQPDRTKAAVINQLNALPAESYEIAIRRRQGGPLIRHTWRRGEIIGSLSSQLKKENAGGADIFIRPIDTRYVLVHNISPAKIDEFKECGFPPSATVETAPGEFQAWVKLTDSPIEEDLSEWIAKELAKYGATPEGHYPSNLGRLAGFTNHEAPTQPGNPAPYVLIHEHQPQIAPN